MTMALYLSRHIGLRIIAVLACILSLAISFDLLENAAEIVGQRGTVALAEYALLRAPLILLTIMPLGVLVGAALAFLTLAARNEMVMLRAAGYNTLRVILLLLPLAALCGLAQSQLAARFGPAAEGKLVERFPGLFETAAIERELWLRDWHAVIRVGRAEAGGALLHDLSIFETGPSGGLLRRIDAGDARYTGDGWILTGVTEQAANESPVQMTEMRWSTRLNPGSILAAARRPELVDMGEVRDVLSGAVPGARSTAFYSIQLWRGYAAFLTPVVMFLFGAMASFGLSRSGGGLGYVATGLFGGALFVVVDGVFSSLGEAGAMNVFLAAFLAPGLFLIAGVWSIVVIEE